MFGYIMEGELKAIDSVLQAPKKPFTAILGGSKVSTKITIIESLMEKVDNLILGGGMTYTFMAALGGRSGNRSAKKISSTRRWLFSKRPRNWALTWCWPKTRGAATTSVTMRR